MCVKKPKKKLCLRRVSYSPYPFLVKFGRISQWIDFIDGLPRLDGKTSIMVVVDRLSKSAHFIAIAHPYTAKTIANKFVEGVVKLHGMPRSIISDRDPVFISNFWQEFLKLSGTKLRMTSAYHP